MTMTSTTRPAPGWRERLQDWLPKLVLAPSFLLILVFVYGFNAWTVFLSFTNSKAFSSTKLIGFANYEKLWNWTFDTDPPSSWYTALVNMGLFGGLYVVICLVLGLGLAILLDQKIRGEGILRPIYLYPLALSFIVTGTAWKLFLDPRIGFCIDVGHAVRANANLVEAIHATGSRLYDVHVKDLANFTSRDSQVAVGEGILPYRDIFQALIDIKYKGFVDLEYEINGNDPMPGVIESFGYMRGVLAGMGYLTHA